MSIPEAPEAFLFQRLTSQTAVSQYIGSRVYPLIAPQGTPLPLVVYQRTGVERPQSLSGNVGNPLVTLQLTTYGTSYTSVKAIARAVRLTVDGWTGTTAGVTLQRTTLLTEADGVDMPADDQMLPYYSVQQSFEFRINEALEFAPPPPTVPGAPTIAQAYYDPSEGGTNVQWQAPTSDGGASITEYRVYFEGNLYTPDTIVSSNYYRFSIDFSGDGVRVSAVNAVGEGPLSAPVTVVEA
jgi:hypothetical protein